MIIKYFDDFAGTWTDISGATGSTLEFGASGWTTSPETWLIWGTISQAGTNDPTLTIVRDNAGAGENLVATYLSTGTYNINSPDSIFQTSNFWGFVSNQSSIDSDSIVIQTFVVDSDNLKIFTYKGGSLTDDILLNTSFEFRYHY